MSSNLMVCARRQMHCKTIHYHQHSAYPGHNNEEPSLRSIDTRQKRMTF